MDFRNSILRGLLWHERKLGSTDHEEMTQPVRSSTTARAAGIRVRATEEEVVAAAPPVRQDAIPEHRPEAKELPSLPPRWIEKSTLLHSSLARRRRTTLESSLPVSSHDASMEPPLVGVVSFRLDLVVFCNQNNNNNPPRVVHPKNKKKRPRGEEKSVRKDEQPEEAEDDRKNNGTTTISTTTTNNCGTPPSHGAGTQPVVGYVFHKNDATAATTTTTQQRTFLLSVPQCLAKQVSHAVLHQQRVRIHRYRLLLLPRDPSGNASTDGPPLNEGRLQGIVELHCEGWEATPLHRPSPTDEGLLATTQPRDSSTSSCSNSSQFFTLSEIQRLEALDQLLVQQPDAASRWTTKRFNVHARIHSVSPILTMDPNDPFALMELESHHHDENNDGRGIRRVVVVIRKQALPIHEALTVGHVVRLHRVKRQQWSVPQLLLRAQGGSRADSLWRNNVPSHILVVEHSDQVEWPDDRPKDDTDAAVADGSHGQVTGVIDTIHKIQVGKDDYLHSIDLSLGDDSLEQQHVPHAVLFVTYFPMSTTLIAALRPGATISAAHLQDLNVVTASGERCYGAILRSQISIVSGASERTDDPPLPPPDDRSTTIVEESSSGMAWDASTNHPYALLRMRRSYLELAVRRIVMPWMEDWHPTIHREDHAPSPGLVLPSLIDLTHAFLQVENVLVHRPQSTARNVFAEFLDPPETPCNIPHATDTKRRVPMTLSHLDAAASVIFLQSCLRHSKEWTFGVMSSIHRFGWELLPSSCMDEPSDTVVLPTVFGWARWAPQSPPAGGSAHAILSNGRLSIPLMGLSPNSQLPPLGSCFVMADVESVVLSVMCIGRIQGCLNQEPEESLLRSEVSLDPSGAPFMGSCRIVRRENRVFLVSLRLVCSGIRAIAPTQCNPATGTGTPPSDQKNIPTIQSILDGTTLRQNHSPDAVFMGLLGRVSLKATKPVQNRFPGLRLVLSHIEPSPEGTALESDVSTIQSAELKVTTGVPDSLRLRLLQCLTQHHPTLRLNSQQVLMACVWWQIATDARSAPMLNGGWDEVAEGASPCSRTTAVQVHVPLSAVSPDPERGYVRFSSCLEDLAFSVVPVQPSVGSAIVLPPPVSTVDFVSITRILPGELHSSRAPRRNRNSARNPPYAIGPLVRPVPAQAAGVPVCSIGDIFRLLCADLRGQSRSHLAPSLVREIRKAQFLGVSYCQVTAECPTCFKALVAYKSPSPLPKSQTKSYWNHPLPGANTPTVPLPKSNPTPTSHLRCPNGCNGPASVKWECSGTLDDGTGQAKLYAERDTARLLLGMSASMTKRIELGVLHHPRGTMVFSRGVPPRPDLGVAVAAARDSAATEFRYGPAQNRSSSGSLLTVEDWERVVLDRIVDPALRAEFELQRHCRCSLEPHRPRHSTAYCVRVKPLSDGMVHGGDLWSHPSEIDVVAVVPSVAGGGGGGVVGRSALTRRIATLTLPPLKLVLVDLMEESDSSS